MKTTLTGLTADEITSTLGLKQSFRGKQIYSWIGKGASTFDEMTNLSKQLREELAEKATIYSSSVTKVLRDPDVTIKLQITLHDGLAIETVLLTDAKE